MNFDLTLAEKIAWILFPGYVMYVIVIQGRKAARSYGRRDRNA